MESNRLDSSNINSEPLIVREKMPEPKNSTDQLSSISQAVKALDNVGGELLHVMDEQIKAIISSDTKKIEQLSESYTSLKGQFEKFERAFIEKLEKIIPSERNSDQPVKLDLLKNIFPHSVSEIDQWKQLLDENASQLKRKHSQLMQLLDFALDRNAEMMHVIYNMSNEKSTHYNLKGDKAGVVSGIAINQEV